MHTKHVTKDIEAYLDGTLPGGVAQQVERHLKQCARCAAHLAEAQRLRQELGTVLQAVLGQPQPPPYLRRRIKAATETRRWESGWGISLRVVNALGAAVVIFVLAVGIYVTIQGQLYVPDQSFSMASQNGGAATPTVSPTSTPPTRMGTSLGDQLPPRAVGATASEGDTILADGDAPSVSTPAGNVQMILPVEVTPTAMHSLTGPTGTIAFPLFDGTMYQTYLIHPDGANQRTVPLPGVSEPALQPKGSGAMLVARSWNDPKGPRTLITSKVDSPQLQSITNFWEDAQPDWSPTENRVIFASQRESDRLWRLYSAWGDGSLEQNLRRQGKSPTFAPDGHRFAYEGCNDSGNECGLWVTNLTNSEFDAAPIVIDSTAKAPDWSPVSDDVVFMAVQGDQWDLFVKNVGGETPVRLTNSPANEGLPVWSPDGQWIAFVSDRAGSWGLWLLHPASGELRQMTAFGNATITAPNRLPYSQHGERNWWDEQISWGP
jgi:predicted anti-sigma-YlaC factor YlaD